MSTFKSAIALGLDCLVVAGFVIVSTISLTGGGTYRVLGVDIRSTSVSRPVVATLMMLLVRLAVVDWRPYFLWFQAVTIPKLEASVLRRIALACEKLDRISTPQVRNTIAIALVFSVSLRLLNVVLHPGFVTGDDVEVQEMAIAKVLGQEWPIWNLRNPLFPMVVLYPVQKLAFLAGIADPGYLVMTGRLVVVAVATLSVWLVYRIAARIVGQATAVLAMVLFACSRLHLWFGSSELPRPVASAFILAAFLLLTRKGALRASVAGVLLAFGGCLRFGELIFFVPALLQLSFEGRWKDTAVVVAAGGMATVSLLAATDWLYWGQPFYSWHNAIEYTILEGRSSRGFQPPLFYLVTASTWTNFAVLGLSLYQFRLPEKRFLIWAWVPIALLSVLPHKEPRYLVAVQPFVCLSAATAGLVLLRRFLGDPRRTRWATALTLCVVASMIREAGDWRFRRTDRAVAFAQQIALSRPQAVAAQQLWRLGGRLYFQSVPVLLELPDNTEDGLKIASSRNLDWVLLKNESATPAAISTLTARGLHIVPAEGLEYLALGR